MSRPMNTYDEIAIAEIVIYSILFIGAVVLNIKHGITKSAGWLYLIILSLARIVGSSLRLATISDPTNVGLYVGWMTCNGLGLGPLILMLLGLMGRLFDSINRQGHVVIQPLYRRLIDLLMMIAMILFIVGGANSSSHTVDGMPKVHYNLESRVGQGLMIAVFALLILETMLMFRNQGYIAQGEHRLLAAIVVSLPFVGVRLVYSCVLILGGESMSVWAYLGASVIMEMIVVIVCETVGFSVAKISPKEEGQRGDVAYTQV